MSAVPAARPKMTQDLVDRILQAKKIDRTKYPVCILGVRGYYLNTMGKPGTNDRGIFDDAAFVSSPSAFVSVNFNTDASRVRVGKGTGSSKGMAMLAEGEWDYKVGSHKGRSPALNQAEKVTVMRDGEVRPYPDTGYFGINHHWGGSSSTSSLGCQTVPPSQWSSYINTIVAELKRYGKTIVKYVLITESEMSEILAGQPVIVAPAPVPVRPAPKAVPMGSSPSRIAARGETTKGMDVSDYQPKMDYAACKGIGIQFCWAKASEGASWKAKHFDQHRAGCREAGILVGAYHFFRSNVSVKSQVSNFMGMVGKLQPGDLVPMLDLESSNGASGSTIISMAREFLEEVEAATGVRPVIYTGPSYFQGLGKSASGFEKYPLWIAHYGTSRPLVPPPWSDWAIHQFGSDMKVPGYPRGIDGNLFNGTLQEFKAMFAV